MEIIKKLKEQNPKNLFLILVITLAIPLTVALSLTQQELRSRAAFTDPLPTVETEAFSGSGDIADDSVIWFNSSNPSQSVVIADNKDSSPRGGIAVFDLTGKSIQFRNDGQIGNVDLREGFMLNGQPITLVGGNNRTSGTVVLYKLNPSTRQLEPVHGSNVATVKPNYGFCMYKSSTGKFYAFVTQDNGSQMEQYELKDNGSGKVDAIKVRSLSVGSQSEGCAADDEAGMLYLGEESKGLWKYQAEPSAPTSRTSVDAAGAGRLVADVEGVTIAKTGTNTGFIIVSSQGNSTFSMYKRESNNEFVRTFKIPANGGIDAVSSTDGIDALNANFGAAFPKGLFVAHDASNTGGSTSNLKFVPLNLVIGESSVTSTITPTSGSSLPECDNGLTCTTCSAPSNTCGRSNGRMNCSYTKKLGGGSCNSIQYTNIFCVKNNCTSPLTCQSGVCR